MLSRTSIRVSREVVSRMAMAGQNSTCQRREFHRTVQASDYWSFLSKLPGLGKKKEKKPVELDESEKEELSTLPVEQQPQPQLQPQSPVEPAVPVSSTSDGPVSLGDFDFRVSKQTVKIARNINGLDETGLVGDDKVYEIGFETDKRDWQSERNGFTIDVWKVSKPEYDQDKVYKIVKFVVAESLGLVNLPWPTEQVQADTLKKFSKFKNPYNLVLSAEIDELPVEFNLEEFQLVDLDQRFKIAKRIVQLTGRRIPDLVLTNAHTVQQILDFYKSDAVEKTRKYGLFTLDFYNPNHIKLVLDPAPYQNTNVRIKSA
ncbi:hypothetical protein V1514DRAFT_327804 [Lipomyces japonicus]|uniref:uncharacterized protein n=1 Tax=Lipomyces japonicus TaxID=56871 RepID=UPI0034CDF577